MDARSRVLVTVGWGWLLMTGQVTVASSISWTAGGGADTNWSNTGNWSHAGDPAGHDVTFDASGAKNSGDTSVCDGSRLLNSLSFRFDSSTLIHQVRIPAGVTLILSNAVSTATNLFVRALATNQYTRVYFIGDGTLELRDGEVHVGDYWSSWSTDSDRARLNLTGLREFRANVGGFHVARGTSSGTGAGYRALVELAATNSIVAPRIDVGSSGELGDGGSAATLRLGESNTVWCSDIRVGYGKAQGTVNFRSGLSNPSVSIRGTGGGSSRAELIVGRSTGSNSGLNQGLVDLSGGSIDALFGTLTIGYSGGSSAGSSLGRFTMGAGTIDAATAIVGRATSSAAGTGRLTIGNTGVFSTDLLKLGDRIGTGATTGTVTIAGGTLAAGGITNGAGAVCSIEFQSGTLANRPGTNLTIAASVPMTLSTASNHVFEAESGRTISIGLGIGESGTAVGPVVKTGSGSLTLAGAHAFTGGLIVSNGAVTLNGSMTNTCVRVENGGSLSGSASLVFNINGAAGDSGIVCHGGTVNLSGMTLAFAGLTPTADSYSIATNAGGTLSGAFATVTNTPTGYTLTNIANAEVRLVKDSAVEVVITVQSNLTYTTGNTLTIGWTTDLEVGGWLAYRKAGSGTDYALSSLSAAGTNHVVTVSGLTELTGYDVVVWSSGSSLPYFMTTLIADPASGDTIWTGVATTNEADWRWRRGVNWDVVQPPGSDSLATFASVGVLNTNAAGDTAVVDSNTVVGALSFAFAHATLPHQIRLDGGVHLAADRSSGDVLTIDGGGVGQTTRVRFVGDGVLGLGGTNATVTIGNYGTTGGAASGESEADRARLDLSGLSVFTAWVNRFGIGYGMAASPGPGYRGWVELAPSNALTARTLAVGDSVGGDGGNFGVLRLGAVNILNVGVFRIGYSKAKGWLCFANTNGTSSAMIRGVTGGVSRAAMSVGIAEGNTGWSYGGISDFTGGHVDALLSTLTLGGNNGVLSGSGTLVLSDGMIDVTTVVLGASSGSGNASGTLTVGGASLFRAGTLTLGDRTSTGGATGTINLNGGTLDAGVITNGAGTGTRILNWTGGTLAAGACYLNSVAQNGATTILSPGLSAVATNRFAGSLVLTAGEWDVDVDANAGACDRVEVDGILDLSGSADTLRIRLLSGPLRGALVIASYGTLSGEFDSRAGFGGSVDYHYRGNQIAIMPPMGTTFLFR